LVLDNEIHILREFAQLESEEHRRHLVKLYHEGQVYTEGKTIPNKAYAMELGEMALNDYLHDNADKLTDDRIKEVATDIALAMRDFHRGTYTYASVYSVLVYIRSGQVKLIYQNDQGNGQQGCGPSDFKNGQRDGQKTRDFTVHGTGHISDGQTSYYAIFIASFSIEKVG
jgi:hypothetical protein